MSNYITTLRDKVATLESEKLAIKEQLDELRDYLLSSKFHGIDNAWVNPSDVLNRLPAIYLD